MLETYNKVHEETDFLLSYLGEKEISIDDEKEFLASKENSSREILICSIINDKIISLASVSALGSREKIKHRATLGISIEKEYWGQGYPNLL